MKIKEADQGNHNSGKEPVDGAAVVRSIKRVFQHSVRPTWDLWEKDERVTTRGARPSEEEKH